MRQFVFTQESQQTALVIVFPIGVKGLFNPAVHQLVREVQEELDDVYVTYALASGSSPSVRDAIAASQFAGCSAAVVVHAGESEDSVVDTVRPTGDYSIRNAVGLLELTPDAVIGAFEDAIISAGRAA